jgi:hypothetical protein
MKKGFFFLFVCLLSFNAKAQDPQLFENDWYLQKLVLDGEDIFPPTNAELEFVQLNIYQDQLATAVCSFLLGFISDIDNNSFLVSEFIAGALNCNIMENNVFDQTYNIGFFDWQYPPQTFQYLIQTGANNDLVLTLTNDDGDLAIYGNLLLSNEDFLTTSITTYPNPVQDILTIKNTDTTEITSIKLYDLLGRLVLTKKDNISEIDVSHLNSGVLFVEIDTGEGVFTRKILKQ